jgi:hypothetical protein
MADSTSLEAQYSSSIFDSKFNSQRSSSEEHSAKLLISAAIPLTKIGQ